MWAPSQFTYHLHTDKYQRSARGDLKHSNHTGPVQHHFLLYKDVSTGVVDLFFNLLGLERIQSYTLGGSPRAFSGRTDYRQESVPLSGQWLPMTAQIERGPGERPATCLDVG